MREDLVKLDRLDEQVRFLGKNNIETVEELKEYRKDAAGKIHLLEWERQVQRNLLRRERRQENIPGQEELKEKIAGINGEIKQLKKELQICDSVEKRSAQIRQGFETMINQEKGEERDELLRGRSGAGRPDVAKRS